MHSVSVAPTLRKFLSFLVFVGLASVGSVSSVGADDAAAIEIPIGTADVVWDNHDPGGFASPYDVGTSPDGSTVFVAGCGRPQGYCHDFLTAAYDSRSGEQLWVARYDGHFATALSVSPDGSRVFVAGNAADRHPFGRVTIAYDAATGAQLWVARYGDNRTESYPVTDLRISPDGARLFVGGYAQLYGHSNDDFLTLAYDTSTGEQLWEARYHEVGRQRARSLAVAADGATLFVGGGVPVMVAYDAETGRERWTYRLGFTGEFEPWAVLAGPGGSNVLAVGRHLGQVAVVTVDALTGEQLSILHRDLTWDVSLGPIPAALSRDGATLFLGANYWDGAYPLYMLTAIDLGSGEDRWEAVGSGYLTSVLLSPSDRTVHVTGDGGSNSTIRAYDAGTGALLWRHTQVDVHVGARALAMTSNGSIVFSIGDHVCEDGPTHHKIIAYTSSPALRRSIERPGLPTEGTRTLGLR